MARGCSVLNPDVSSCWTRWVLLEVCVSYHCCNTTFTQKVGLGSVAQCLWIITSKALFRPGINICPERCTALSQWWWSHFSALYAIRMLWFLIAKTKCCFHPVWVFRCVRCHVLVQAMGREKAESRGVEWINALLSSKILPIWKKSQLVCGGQCWYSVGG